MKASSAVTLKTWRTPAVVVAGKSVTDNVWAVAAVTVAVNELVSKAFTVSTTVTVLVPALFRVTVKLCCPALPAVKAEFAGSPALGSVLEKWTVPR